MFSLTRGRIQIYHSQNFDKILSFIRAENIASAYETGESRALYYAYEVDELTGESSNNDHSMRIDAVTTNGNKTEIIVAHNYYGIEHETDCYCFCN